MRCKYYADITADWDEFARIQKNSGIDAKKICTGISFCKDKFPRTFCSCGHMSTSVYEEDRCPDCGGKLLHFEEGYYSSVKTYPQIYRDGDNLNFDISDVSIRYSGTDCSLQIDSAVIGSYDTKSGNWVRYDPDCYRRGGFRYDFPKMTDVAMANIKTEFPRFFELYVDSEVKYFESRGFRESVVALVIYSSHPKTFSDEVIRKYPKASFRLITAAVIDEVNGGSKGVVAKICDDFLLTWELIGIPKELLPTLETATENCDNLNITSAVFTEEFSDFLKTPLGGFFLSRIRHGQTTAYQVASCMKDCKSIMNDYGIDEDVLIFACRENADVYGNVSTLLNEIRERIDWLRQQHIPVDENSLRTKVFNKAYNLANFRKTLMNTDIEDLIQNDPLKLIDRIR